MRPRWLYHGAKNEASFLSGSMVRPEMEPGTEPDWLHYEARLASP